MSQPTFSPRLSIVIGLLLAIYLVNGCGTAATDGVVSETPTVPVESDPAPAAASTPSTPE